MTKKINRVHYTLNPFCGTLSDNEIKLIIRGADDVVFHAGRALLVKLLKGSKDKKIIELGLDKNPSYGSFNEDTLELIGEKVDWMIAKGRYLKIEYDYRLPLLVYEDRGLWIAEDLISDEYVVKISESIKKGDFSLSLTFRDKNRNMIFKLLEKIRYTKDKSFIPFLEVWKENDYKKVISLIDYIIKDLL